MHVVNASRSREEVEKRLDMILSHLEKIEKNREKVMKGLRKVLNKNVDGIVERLVEHLSSKDVKERFSSWSLEEVPARKGSWTEVEENVNTLLFSRVQEFVYQWEDKTKAFENAHLSLTQRFQNCYDDVELQLQDLQSDAIDVDFDKERFLTFRISRFQKLGWIVKGFFYGSPTLGVRLNFDLKSACKQSQAHDSKKWTGLAVQALYKDLLSSVSVGILARFRNKNQLKSFVNDKLKDTQLCLDRIEARLSEKIKADRDLYEQCKKEKPVGERSAYQSLFHEVEQQRHQLALFGLTEVCAVRIDREKLNWKEETSSCLGSGSFGNVYKGTMKSGDGKITTVALKVWKEALDVDNAIKIMEEMKNLRYEANFQR